MYVEVRWTAVESWVGREGILGLGYADRIGSDVASQLLGCFVGLLLFCILSQFALGSLREGDGGSAVDVLADFLNLCLDGIAVLVNEMEWARRFLLDGIDNELCQFSGSFTAL